ncbi:MAG: class I SAM-dependent methyltransferase [Acidobacteria bacterium]|nr:MAG: class I SAM-dependent methyltransferase [Acidobacteriota bacterium]
MLSPALAELETGIRRPASRLRDLLAAPLHDLAVRDHLLFQFCPLRCGMQVLEAGPGNGYTGYRLAPLMQQVTLVDVKPLLILELQRRFASVPNVNAEVADLASTEWPRSLRDYDLVFGLDVFEYVPDPAQGLRNACRTLRNGGMLFFSFPNYPPPKGDGVTRFETRAPLDAMLRAAGFARWDIFAVQLHPWARAVYEVFHEWPLRTLRRVRRKSRTGRPQTFDQTWTFQNRFHLVALKGLLHLIWLLAEGIMQAGGPLFHACQIAPAGDPTTLVYGHLVVRAWKD